MATQQTAEELIRRPFKATYLNTVKGKRYYRFPVKVIFNDSRTCRTVEVRVYNVTASTAAEAANYIVEALNRPETEVIAYGVRGGKTKRYIGWHSAIARELFSGADTQPRLTGVDFS